MKECVAVGRYRESCNADCDMCQYYQLTQPAHATDTQVGGQHYTQFEIQPVEFCQKNMLHWCEANIVKYACRHSAKNGAEDVRKIIHYAKLLLELEYKETL